MAQQILISAIEISSNIDMSTTFSIIEPGGADVIPNTCTKADLINGIEVIVDSDVVTSLVISATSGVCDGIDETVTWAFNCNFDVDVDIITPTPTPTPTETPNCDFDVDVDIVTPTATPTPTPTLTPNCDFDVDVDIVTPTPTPTPTNTPTPTPTVNCDFDVDVDIVTPTPTPTPTNTPTPTPTSNCDFDVDVDIVTPTATPTPTNTPTATATPTPTPTSNCDFDVDVDIVTPTPTEVEPTPTATPTPTPTSNCDFDVDVDIVTPTPTPTSTSTPTPTPTSVGCPPNCGTEIVSDLFMATGTSISGVGIYDLGGYCAETQGVDTQGQEWWYDSTICTVYTREYSGGSNTTCVGEHVTPVGTQVSSVIHSLGTLTPTGTNVLYDTGIRFIDSNNNAVFVVTEWHSSLFDLVSVHILCDCTFEGSVTEYVGGEIVIDENTEINIFFDSSGSMTETLSPLQTMRDTILKNCLLPFYNNDETKYNQNVTITSIGNERTFNWLQTTGSIPETTKVINLVFTDENQSGYHDGGTGWQTSRTSTYNTDMSDLRNVLSSVPNSEYYRAVIFRVSSGGSWASISEIFRQFLVAVMNGTYVYGGTNGLGLSDKTEIGLEQNVTAASTANYYANIIINALNNLGYNIPNCN